MKERFRSLLAGPQAWQWLPRNFSYYLKGGSSLAFSHLVGLVLGFLTTYLFTNYTSQQTYANFGYVLSVLSIASLAALPGVDSAVLYASAKGHDGALQYGTQLRLKSSFLGTLGMLAWAVLLYAFGRYSEAEIVAWCSLLVPLLYPFSTVFSYLQGKQRFTEYAITNLIVEAGKAVVVAVVVLAFHLDGPPVVLSLFLTMGIAYFLLTRFYRSGETSDIGSDFYSVSRMLTSTAIVGMVASQIDRLIVGTFFGLADMAAYNLAYTLTNPLRGFGTLAGRLLFPHVVQSDAIAPLFLRKYGLGLAALAVGLSGLVISYWFIFPLVQPSLFPGYESAIPVARWLIMATALGIFDIVAAQVLWGLNNLRTVYVTQTFFPIQRIILLAIGGYWRGIEGILVAQVIHYGLSGVIIVSLWLYAYSRR